MQYHCFSCMKITYTFQLIFFKACQQTQALLITSTWLLCCSGEGGCFIGLLSIYIWFKVVFEYYVTLWTIHLSEYLGIFFILILFWLLLHFLINQVIGDDFSSKHDSLKFNKILQTWCVFWLANEKKSFGYTRCEQNVGTCYAKILVWHLSVNAISLMMKARLEIAHCCLLSCAWWHCKNA